MGFRHAVHVRVNDWKIGDYESLMRDGEIIVGQLCNIDKDSGIGVFRGYVLNDTLGKKREGQAREWKAQLTLAKPSKVNGTYISRYESLVRRFNNE